MPSDSADPVADAELERLIAACAQRDSTALRGLYTLTSPKLFGCMVRILKRRALAEEALQDVFVGIWQRAAQYDASRGRPWAWLISIARYRAIDVLRNERVELYREAEIEELPELAMTPESGGAGSRRTAEALARCLGLLSAEQRRGIELAFINGRSHAQIAQTIGQPLGTVKSWIRRGLKSLRDCMGP
jgi:RNA polymerase sigma-70 factor (ECF subfamily)